MYKWGMKLWWLGHGGQLITTLAILFVDSEMNAEKWAIWTALFLQNLSGAYITMKYKDNILNYLEANKMLHEMFEGSEDEQWWNWDDSDDWEDSDDSDDSDESDEDESDDESDESESDDESDEDESDEDESDDLEDLD